MRKRIALTSIPAVAAAAVFGTGCEIAGSSPGDMPVASFDRSLSSTAAGVRVTGGGRIDPNPLEKTTFGFTVDGTSGPPFRGQLQTVFHFLILKAHSVLIDEFEQMATCAHVRGTVRTSDGHDNHRFRAVACDNGEPGSSPGTGPDKFGICVDHHRSTDPLAQNPITRECQRDPNPTELTGGNIQLH
jgi:hypothetical protein